MRRAFEVDLKVGFESNLLGISTYHSNLCKIWGTKCGNNLRLGRKHDFMKQVCFTMISFFFVNYLVWQADHAMIASDSFSEIMPARSSL